VDLRRTQISIREFEQLISSVRDPRQSRGLEFVNRSKRLSRRLKAAESIAYLKVFSAIPAACPQLPFFTYISPDCLHTLILPLTFVGCIYSSFSLSFGIHTEVFYIVVNVKYWESPDKAGGLPFKLQLWFNSIIISSNIVQPIFIIVSSGIKRQMGILHVFVP